MNFHPILESYLVSEVLIGNAEKINPKFYLLEKDNVVLYNKLIGIYPNKIGLYFRDKYAPYAYKALANITLKVADLVVRR
jgi:hypothetical protein